jgi:hypothetical protein
MKPRKGQWLEILWLKVLTSENRFRSKVLQSVTARL